MSRRALITGITGQAGKYLSELLLSEGYEVFGMIRRASNASTGRIAHLLDRITLVSGDLLDEYSLVKAVERSEPDEVYNLAAMSLVPTSWEQPVLTAEVTGLGAMRMLNAARTVNPKVKFLQASSSEMYGLVRETPQTETTPFHPRSPYAVAKVFAHHATVNARESYGMFACTSISFNFESPCRGAEFVTKKITDGVARIVRGEAKELRLGNIHAKRDWSYAGDTVRAMHMIMQHDTPDDFVVANGETHSVEEFLEIAFGYVGLDHKKYVVIDEKFIRPAEVPLLLGDPAKIRRTLGWQPTVTFRELVNMMIEAELEPEKRKCTHTS